MCRHCKYRGRHERCHSKRRPKRSQVQEVTGRGEKWKQKGIQKKNIRKIHVGTQLDPLMLSPLFVKVRHPSRARDTNDLEITPEMIYEALKKLRTWHDIVDFKIILKYILTHYPVNKNKKQAKAELLRKLEVASLAGIIQMDYEDRCRLQTSLEHLRQIPEDLVTRFWELYCNTMDPLRTQNARTVFLKPKEETDSDVSLLSLDEK